MHNPFLRAARRRWRRHRRASTTGSCTFSAEFRVTGVSESLAVFPSRANTRRWASTTSSSTCSATPSSAPPSVRPLARVGAALGLLQRAAPAAPAAQGVDAVRAAEAAAALERLRLHQDTDVSTRRRRLRGSLVRDDLEVLEVPAHETRRRRLRGSLRPVLAGPCTLSILRVSRRPAWSV